MISKELLSEVLPFGDIDSLISYGLSSDGDILLQYEDIDEIVNIYELAHKCKEWAFSYKFDFEIIRIKNVKNYGKIFVRVHTIHTNQCNGKEFYPFDREPEAIFKACQWILDNKENK